MSLARRENSRNDHRAGMYRAAFERVVKVLAVCGRSIDERRSLCTEARGMTDRCAGAGLINRCQRSSDVPLLARRDAQTGYVEHKLGPDFARCGFALWTCVRDD